MKNNNSIKQNLDYIAQTEGDGFKFDLENIEKDYLKLQTDKSSLAIKILSIFGGLLANVAFVVFLLFAGLLDSEIAMVVLGTILIAGALYLNVGVNKLVIDTLSISTYLAGFFLLAFGLGGLINDENTIGILFILISLISIRVTLNYMLSFISILVISGSILFLIFNNEIYEAIHFYNALVLFGLVYCFLNEAKLMDKNKIVAKVYNPLRIGLIVSLLIGFVIVAQRGVLDISIKYIWVSSVVTISLSMYVIRIIVKIIGVTHVRSLVVIYTLSTLILAATALSPAISGSLLIILLCYLVNYKLGLSIGIISFIYFISQYYYDLNFTLLTKSIILFSSGIVFLLFYFFTHKKLISDEKV